MTIDANLTIKAVCDLIPEENKYDILKKKLSISNPKVASFYCLPKTHKNGMRPISSNINVPSQNLASLLLDKLKEYPINYGFSIKNTIQCTKEIKNTRLEDDEILVSFDLVNCYTNIPVGEAFQALQHHLEQYNVEQRKIQAYLNIAETCMQQNFFHFRGKYYKQTSGLSMGSKLSPLLANLFLSQLEEKVKGDILFPRIWKRYVDDVLAVVKENNVEKTLDMLNNIHTNIKFTVEKEHNGTLPYLDVSITKQIDNNIKFAVYRKPTQTNRYITNDSYHSVTQKKAAFNSMMFRLFNIPMEKQDFETEKDFIYETAQINGYNKKFIDNIYQKFYLKNQIQKVTCLSPIKKERRYISIPYSPKLSNSLQPVFKKHGFILVTYSSNTIKYNLCNYKDKEDLKYKSGIYSFPCENCSFVYIGQTRRRFEIRKREHDNAVKKKLIERSAIAEHMVVQNHEFNSNNGRLLKAVSKENKLNAWESFYMNIEWAPLMNRFEAPTTSPLFKLIYIDL